MAVGSNDYVPLPVSSWEPWEMKLIKIEYIYILYFTKYQTGELN